MSGKKILFVGLWYHDYTQALIDEMRSQGHTVEYIDIQPRTLLFKMFSTLARSIYGRYLNFHHRRSILAHASQAFDVVLFLQAHQMSPDNLKLLKGTQKRADFRLYNWDALSNHNYLAQAPFFDGVYTFDKTDAAAHDFHYLPLFCVRFIQDLNRHKAQRHTIYMVGNIVNIKRYAAVQKFQAYCDAHRILFKTYLVCSPVVYFRMLMQRQLPRGLHFRSVSKRKFTELLESSSAVFDFANHAQTGYTMRTVENLCAGKKIITNNQLAKSDFFYSEDRILCFDDFDFSAVRDFLDVPIAQPEEKFDTFHIQSFIQRLLGTTPSASKSVSAAQAS